MLLQSVITYEQKMEYYQSLKMMTSLDHITFQKVIQVWVQEFLK